MFDPIETERLHIRCFVADDERAVLAYAADPATMHYMEDGAMDEAGVRAFIADNMRDDAHDYAVVRRADGVLVGHMPFFPWFSAHTYEIGWVIAPHAQGRGYATEAAEALFDYGFRTLGIHRIIATCQPQNPASWRVMEKLGMRREAHFVQASPRPDGTWWDEYFYAVLEGEWWERTNNAGT